MTSHNVFIIRPRLPLYFHFSSPGLAKSYDSGSGGYSQVTKDYGTVIVGFACLPYDSRRIFRKCLARLTAFLVPVYTASSILVSCGMIPGKGVSVKRQKTILAIDDQENLLKLVRANLEVAGYEVITSTSPHQGLILIKEKNPALVLLDMMMPEMDGPETLRHIREISKVPVIVLTAVDDPKCVSQAMRAGADDYVTKPFNVRELLARVNAKLRRFSEEPR